MRDKISKRFAELFSKGQVNLVVIYLGSRNKVINFLRVMIQGKKWRVLEEVREVGEQNRILKVVFLCFRKRGEKLVLVKKGKNCQRFYKDEMDVYCRRVILRVRNCIEEVFRKNKMEVVIL